MRFTSPIYRKQILNKKGNELRKVLFRYASSIHETNLRTVDGSTVRKSLPSVRTQKIFQLPKISFSEANDGPTVRTVDRSTVRQSPPQLHTQNLQKSGTGTLAVSFYGSTVRSVDQFTYRQQTPWFHTWSDFPDLSSIPCLLIYGHNLRTLNGPTVRRSPPWMPFFCIYFSCLYTSAPERLSCKT